METKEYNFGGTRVKIVSPLAALSDGERAEYLRKELAAGNPVLKEIERAVNNVYKPS